MGKARCDPRAIREANDCGLQRKRDDDEHPFFWWKECEGGSNLAIMVYNNNGFFYGIWDVDADMDATRVRLSTIGL